VSINFINLKNTTSKWLQMLFWGLIVIILADLFGGFILPFLNLPLFSKPKRFAPEHTQDNLEASQILIAYFLCKDRRHHSFCSKKILQKF
jgi:hypothetical protein